MKSLLIILFVFTFSSLYSQNSDSYVNTDKYTVAVLPTEFNTQFKGDDDKENFKKLREFRSEKIEILAALKNRRLYSYDNSKSIPFYQNKIKAIDNIINKKNDEDKVTVDANLIYSYRIGDTSSSLSKITIGVNDLKQIRDDYSNQIDITKEKASETLKLDSNINNVKDDLRACEDQIDSALAPEYKQQQFRVTISICFTILIGILLIIFFTIVYLKSDNGLSKDLLSGNGLQFVTLFVLIIAVILFGILGILQSSELAAILSGISGYILGKGTQKDLATTLSNSTIPPVSQPSALTQNSVTQPAA